MVRNPKDFMTRLTDEAEEITSRAERLAVRIQIEKDDKRRELMTRQLRTMKDYAKTLLDRISYETDATPDKISG